MRELTILNPTAGKGKIKIEGAYVTKEGGDCRRFVREACLEDPDTHFTVYGGDGTLNEAVSGIMDAGAGDRASVTSLPTGSGNDAVKTLDTHSAGKEVMIDLIKIGSGYGINMLNIGFDCNVVASAQRYKKAPLVSGNLSYLMGVAREFFRPFGEPFRVEAECADGEVFSFDEPALLCAVCNGQWCGGSFHNSPLSDMTDGVLEMILVRKMGRGSFINMIGGYKKGTLIDRETGELDPKYEGKIIYKKIRKMSISGCKTICSDGEIFSATSAEISVIPGTIRYVSPEK